MIEWARFKGAADGRKRQAVATQQLRHHARPPREARELLRHAPLSRRAAMGLRATEHVDLAAACVGAKPKGLLRLFPAPAPRLARTAVADVRERHLLFSCI